MILQPDFIHEFVPGTSNRTLLLLHGTGGNERDLITLGHELDARAALLSPRGKVLELSFTRVWIGGGDQDSIIPTSEIQRLVRLLRRAGADVTIHFAKAGHGLTNGEVETAGGWLKDLKPSAART